MARNDFYLEQGDADQITRAMPANNITQAGDAIKGVQDELAMSSADFGALLHVTYEVAADASSGVDVIASMPYAVELLDVVVQCRAANASGTAQVRKGTTAITDAIAMAVDNTVARAGTITDAQSSFAVGDTLNVITNGAADRGLVTMIFRLS